MTPTRFRADPKLVRVGIRTSPDGSYVATVSARDGSGHVVKMGDSPWDAICSALHEADRQNFSGIDLHMQWAYEHPHSPV